MKKLIAVASMVLAAACAPSINPQMQSATDSMLSVIKGSHSEQAPASFSPMEWEVGQWLVFKSTDVKNERPAVVKISVVGREGQALWVETESQDYFHHSISKTLYAKMPRNKDEVADAVLKIVTKTDDKAPQVLDFSSKEPGAALMKSMMKSTIQGISAPEVSLASTESVAVAAGSFQGCGKSTGKVTVGPMTVESTGWFHPAVPLSGMVKSESTDGTFKSELLDYGISGAKSALE